MSLRIVLLASVLSALPCAAGALELPTKPQLTLEVAQRLARAAMREADRRNTGVVIAIVDDGGHLLVLERLDGTQVASSEVAIAKARTAAIFRRPSKVFEDQVRDGRVAAITLPGATPLQGGLPLSAGETVIGAIGVSGNTPQQDEEIAAVGAARLSALLDSGAAPAKVIPAGETDRAFAKGAPLHEVAGYKVHASRRDAPGVGEVHLRDTDIIHVLEGEATFVTGGQLIEPKTIGPGEVRGSGIRGGVEQRIAKGDVIIVPAGTAHWFKAVKPPVLYFVVKPTDAEE